MALERTLVGVSFIFLIYIGVAGIGLWLAWQFVQAFTGMEQPARSGVGCSGRRRLGMAAT